MKEIDYYDEGLKTLKQLKKEYPNLRLGQHLSMAFADYGDTFHVSNKEMSFALTKYQAELEFNTVSDSDIEEVIRNTEEMFGEVEVEQDDWETEIEE